MSSRGRVAALEASNVLIFDGNELEGNLALSDVKGDNEAVLPLVRPPEDDLDDETEDLLSNFDAYHEMRFMEDDDLENLTAIRFLFAQHRR